MRLKKCPSQEIVYKLSHIVPSSQSHKSTQHPYRLCTREYITSSSSNPFNSIFPFLAVFRNRSSSRMVFIIASRRITLAGSPIQVEKIRYP